LDVIDYFDNGMALAPSVMQVPLADTPFNRSKSNIAFIEGAYWGAICVVPEWWEVPALSYKDNNEYYECLTLAFGANSAYTELAWNYVKDNLLLSNINRLRVELIKNL
jgi:hypothetical protein